MAKELFAISKAKSVFNWVHEVHHFCIKDLDIFLPRRKFIDAVLTGQILSGVKAAIETAKVQAVNLVHVDGAKVND